VRSTPGEGLPLAQGFSDPHLIALKRDLSSPERSRGTRVRVLAMHFAPELFTLKKAKPRKASPKGPPQKERREVGRQKTRVEKDRIIKRCGAHPDSCPPVAERTEAGSLKELGLTERARSPFGAPPRHFAGFHPGSARAALPGITGCKREDPLRHQCSEHLAVRTRAGRDDAQAARERSVSQRSREPPPLRLKEYPRDKASFTERDGENVTAMETIVKGDVALLGTRRWAD
jgi:hypothetical protein